MSLLKRKCDQGEVDKVYAVTPSSISRNVLEMLDYILGLKKLGVVLKRAKYFILCKGRAAPGIVMTHQAILRALLSDSALDAMHQGEQLSLFDPTMEDVQKCITGQI